MQEINYKDAKVDFFVHRIHGKRVLDLGVVQHRQESERSPNWLHRAIVENSAYCLGLDINQEGVRFLEEKGFRVMCADAQNFSIDEQFDVVSAGDIIEHLSNVGGFLNSIAKHLSDEGVLLLSTPNPFWWKTLLLVATGRRLYVNAEHTCWFCARTLRQVLARHGYEMVEMHYGSVFAFHSTFHKFLRVINTIIPLPRVIRHNTLMAVAKVATKHAPG